MKKFLLVFASAKTDDLYIGTFQGYAIEPNIFGYYSNSVLSDFSTDEFLNYGTTEQNCYRYYTEDFR